MIKILSNCHLCKKRPRQKFNLSQYCDIKIPNLVSDFPTGSVISKWDENPPMLWADHILSTAYTDRQNTEAHWKTTPRNKVKGQIIENVQKKC